LIEPTTEIIEPTANQTEKIEPTANQTENITEPAPTEQTAIEAQNATRAITIDLQYNKDSLYDEDNDGKESIKSIVDLSISNTKFNWDADESKLCTKWETYSVDEDKVTTICFGNEECCNFLGYLPLRDSWKEPYYAAFNQYGAGLDNIISSQVVYYDVDLSAKSPKVEILNSSWSGLPVKFFYGMVSFSLACAETCKLSGINQSSYKLIIEVINTILNIDTITYTVEEKVKKNEAPLLIKDVPNLEITKNQYITLNLSEYFYDQDELIYSYGENENIDISFNKDIATIVPAKDFVGVINTHFSANDKEKTAASNLFSINVTEIPANVTEITPVGLALINDIPNITVAANKNATIDLSQYFANIDENTIFTYLKQDGITILFDNKIATILIDGGFAGIVYTFITATQNGDAVISNLFSITATNATIDITPAIILDKKDFMLDEDVELDFEYLEKEELIEHGRWKEQYEVYEDDTILKEEELELLRVEIEEEEKLLTAEEKAIKKQKKKWQKATESIEAFVYDNEGSLEDMNVEIEELREGKFDIKIPKQRAFRAGKYKLKIDLLKDSITYTQEQDFTWGVLAININKSIYLENENSFIGIGVLDDAGRVVCNADVILEIINPLNQKTTLTTTNGDIKISPECQVLGVTELPDYYTTYSVDGVGTYAMNLT
ncbi:MAG: hypothetical protein AAB414_04945, partial [Patescibacteria group bacterium]